LSSGTEESIGGYDLLTTTLASFILVIILGIYIKKRRKTYNLD